MNFTPSNRTRPLTVAIQIYPSVVWVIAEGWVKKPSCVLQAVWPYCEISLCGSTPHAQFAERKISRMTRQGNRGTFNRRPWETRIGLTCWLPENQCKNQSWFVIQQCTW